MNLPGRHLRSSLLVKRGGVCKLMFVGLVVGVVTGLGQWAPNFPTSEKSLGRFGA
jgi:hypothetical protein